MIFSDNFNFYNYCTERRWLTYYKQLKFAIKSNSKSILVIGPGDYIVPLIIKHYKPKITVETFDIIEGATYQGDLKSISSTIKKKYDYIICCEVLEHIEFEYFENIINQLKNITDKLLISLPLFNDKINRYHKWEINYKDMSLPIIIDILKKHFSVVNCDEICNKKFFECCNI